MSLQELLKELVCRGVIFELASGGERLKIVAPKGTITDEIRQVLGMHKEAILSLQRYRRDGGCYCCKGSRFWLSTQRTVICGACHPPAAPSLVAEWIELMELTVTPSYGKPQQTTGKPLHNLVDKPILTPEANHPAPCAKPIG